MAEENTLKSYNTKLRFLNKDLDKLKEESSDTNKKIVLKKREIVKLEKSIKKLHNGNIVITEHAILRYLERVQGIDIEGIKRMMIDDRTRGAINVLTTGRFPIQGGTLEVKDNVVITVIKD